MQVSIIIPTYNGAHKVVNALQSLAQQDRQDFEVIVVIDGSTDDTEAILRRQGWGLKNLQIVVQKNGGRSISRNQGAKVATGDLLVFFDDDTRTLDTCIDRHVKHHASKENTLLVGSVPEDLAKMQTDFQRYKAHLSQKWITPLPATTPLTKQNLFLTAANFSIPKALFWELGGFDERLRDAEDFDLGVRAFQRRIEVYFDKENIAWHDDFISCRSYIKRLKQYAHAHEVLLELKPEVYTDFNQYQPKPISFIKKVVYGVFSAGFWVWCIDNFNFLKVLPTRLRYKLYDIITYAHTSKK